MKITVNDKNEVIGFVNTQLTQQNAMLTQQLTELKTNKTNTEGDV
ncbi:DUF2977 domain-containing protein [Salmonella enterica]|nr:DUF2977 domain-containing protein [Salmonella enterica]